MRTPKLLSKLNLIFSSSIHSPKRMVEPDANSRGPGFSNNVFQGLKDGDNENGNGHDTETRSPRMLSDKGVCGNCSLDGLEESVCCFLCKKLFHALCNTLTNSKVTYLTDNPCTKSFHNSYSQNIANKNKGSRFGSFVFLCDLCRTKHETKEACTTNNRVQILDNRVTNLADDVGEIKRMLQTVMDAGRGVQCSPLDQQNMDMAHSNAQNVEINAWHDKDRVKSLLVVAKDAQVTNSNLEKAVVDNGLQVQKQYIDKNGDTILIFPSQKARDGLKQKLAESGVDQNLLKEPKKRHPTISVVGIPKEFDMENKKDICDTILKQNPTINEGLKAESSLFDIISVKPLRSNPHVKQAIIRVSDNIRVAIRNNHNRLYFGLLSCQVYDQLYIKRCNKCQGFGHYARTCSNQMCCGLCGTIGHETQGCPHKDKPDLSAFYRCVNCSKSNATSGTDNKHPAYYQNCPSYQVQQEKLKASLPYYSKN